MHKVYGISGVATSGKDNLYRLLNKVLTDDYGIKSVRTSFADQAKVDIHDFVKDKFGINILNPTPQEKEFIRPFMVWYACAKREQSKGKHWVNAVKPTILYLTSKDYPVIPFITDVRFNEYEEDETSFVKSTGGLVIHVSRYTQTIYGDKIFVGPANKTEFENDPKVKAVADITVELPTAEDEVLIPHVKEIAKMIIENENR